MKIHNIEVRLKAYLESEGFLFVDHTIDGQEIWRQKDDDPKMDITIDFNNHDDNL